MSNDKSDLKDLIETTGDIWQQVVHLRSEVKALAAREAAKVSPGEFCVVADNGDEVWAYGPFKDEDEANKFAEMMNNKYESIPYTVGTYHNKFAAEKEEAAT